MRLGFRKAIIATLKTMRTAPPRTAGSWKVTKSDRASTSLVMYDIILPVSLLE